MASLAMRWLQEGKHAGEKEKAQVITRNLIKAGLEVDFISKATGLNMKEIQKLKTEQ